jgi:hypothetical protein
VVARGFAKKPEHRQAACRLSADLVAQLDLPLVVMGEEWPGSWRSQKTAVGMGKAWGLWLDHIHFILGVKEAHIVRVNPSKWRSELYGKEHYKTAGGKEDGFRTLALAYTGVKDHNEAEAICIACWTHTSERGLEAAEKAAKRRRKEK